MQKKRCYLLSVLLFASALSTASAQTDKVIYCPTDKETPFSITNTKPSHYRYVIQGKNAY
jgi:hypothetical protein